ncbi:M23 family metallopeptidase [Microvirga puerhi]|uniref:M23 family metallopeptidase n=1 Tax=Microvirga puerhi TaxID=2876078 RepID=A0ABS7VTK0_9HYPH|nr:M23 family metallopeptidase [Microvirga puerhi]MBZ6078904.1 M23 family metallopeptidase [Microvirga puerhi]
MLLSDWKAEKTGEIGSLAGSSLAAVVLVALGASTALAVTEGGGGASGTCLLRPSWSEGGELVTSPYGVDRTGRASAGFHQGLDIVNSAGRGDPIYAGVNGKVQLVRSGSGGNYVVTETGNQRFIYMHLDRFGKDAEVGKSINPDSEVGKMGSSGANAVHIHLGMLMRGDALRGSGTSSRVWASRGGNGGTKGSQPLTSQEISSAVPDAWYFVNPEPFLHHRIKFRPGVLSAYGGQMSRPDGMTLPKSCSVSSDEWQSSPYSSNGGVSQSEGMGSTLIGGAGTSDYATDTVNNSERSFYADIARQGHAGLEMSTQKARAGRRELDVALGLLILGELKGK